MSSVVERCFGVLKQRFRCLQKHRVLQHQPDVAKNIVVACAALHNLCLDRGEPLPYDEEGAHSADRDEPGASSTADASGPFHPAPSPGIRLYDLGLAVRQAQMDRLMAIVRQRCQHRRQQR